MSLVMVSSSAANATVGTNLLTDSIHSVASRPRTLRGAALGGSAAAGDTKLELYVGAQSVGELFNSKGGANQVPTGDDLFPVGAPVPGGTEIRAIVTDAPATNAVYLVLDLYG